MSIDSAISIAWDVLKNLVVPIKRHFGYIVFSKSYARDLQEEVKTLAYEFERVHYAAEDARNNLRSVYSQVTDWQASAEKALKEVQDLLGNSEEADKSCCYDTLPDLNCRYQFSRKAKDKIEVIQRLVRVCSAFKDISFTGPALENVTAPTLARRKRKDVFGLTTATSSVSFSSTLTMFKEDAIFESRASIILKIIDALADNRYSTVGVHGMGGVGKSTLLVDAKEIIRENNSFDLVAKADVSVNPDIRKIQGEIAQALSLNDIKKEECVELRANLLHRRLKDEVKKKKKVLIILDNLWKELDLKSVGIPCGHDNKVIGCKLLLTARDQHVLLREMACDEVFCLDGLKEEEAKRLFERIMENKVNDEEFKPLVDEAIYKCAGLPFLITAMARLFKDAPLTECKNALKQMSETEIIGEKINNILQLSYDHLKGKNVQSLLQLIVVYGVSRPSLENLVRYGVGLGLLGEDFRIEEARDRLNSLIGTLKASSFLLENGDGDGFKIHDLVREFVVLVASRDHPLLVVKDKDKLVTKLWKDKLKTCREICFPYIDMKELPRLDCPELHIFLLFANNRSLEVPDSYFNFMRKLMVLNLSGIHLTHSPLPFQFLENLQTLCLDDCLLEDVAILGELKGLQILSFVNSKFDRLPKEIGQLAQLRLLDLNDCSQLQIIEPGVLGSLIKLEELYMENSFHAWNAVEQTPPTNASFLELNKLENLFTLHVSIPDPDVLPKNLIVDKLTRYRIQIGLVWFWSSDYRTSKALKLMLNQRSDILQKVCIRATLDDTDELFLDGFNGIQQSFCKLSRDDFSKLKHLHIKNSPCVHYILRQHNLPAFMMLESLLLKNLVNLKKICHSHVSSESFRRLKIVRVESCDKMEVLFPLSLVRELPQLKEIGVADCNLMQEIVGADACGNVELQNLHVLELCDLPSIKNFVTARTAPSSSMLYDHVGSQAAFFNGQQVSIPFLESLTMAGLPNLNCIWSDESPLRLSNLRYLRVARCKSLSKVINFALLIKLHKLHTLNIEQCNLVQEIFDFDRPSASGNIETLCELTAFYLHGLPSLRQIWNMNPHGIVTFHNLKELRVSDCDNLEFIFFPSIVKSLTQLRELSLWDCKKMEVIIMEEDGSITETLETLEFPRLTYLSFGHLESLTCFSHEKCSQKSQRQDLIKSHSTALFNREVAFRSLERLHISRMDNIKMICGNQVYFQHLKTLDVSHCDGLSYLFTLTIADNLVELTNLRISNCKIMAKVIFDEEGEEGCVVAFQQLKYMELDGLTQLRCFSSSGCTLIFPLLEDVIVTGCPNMKLFSKGPIEALQLEGVQVTTKVRFWKGNLNNTIQNMFNEMATVAGVKSMQLSEFPELIGKWQSELIPIKSSWQLESLMVDKCPFINAISSRLMLVLDNMRKLQVRDCKLLEEIFNLEGLEAMESTWVLSWLEYLDLVNLPKLRQLWNKDLQGMLRFNSLNGLTLNNCSSLRHVFAPSMVQCLATLARMEIKECGQIEEVITEEEGQGSPMKKITFPKLYWMKLECLPNLTSFFSGKNYMLSCPRLEKLTIVHCPKMRSFTPQPLMETNHDTPSLFNLQVQFPRLNSMVLSHMDDLSKIWTNTCQENLVFKHLWKVEVQNCKSLENLFPYWLATSLNQIEKLRVEFCMIEEIIASGDDAPHSATVPVLFPKLTSLVLYDMPQLKSFCPNLPTLNWPFLKNLQVTHCDKLNILFFAAAMNKKT